MPIAIGPDTTSTPVPPDLSPSAFARLYTLTPEGATAYLAQRGQLAISYDWRALWEAEHAAQFTVSRLARLDLLRAIQDGITASVGGDLTRRDWMRDMETLLRDAGWWGTSEVVDPSTGEVLSTRFDAQRLRLILDTNSRQAHSAARWARIQAAKGTHPYLRYVTKDDTRVRPAHADWHNLCLPVDHPFWLTHYPLNGWRCRCRVIAISQAEYDRLVAAGIAKTRAPTIETAPWLNKWTGETLDIPVGIDPGFSYNVGIASARQAAAAQVEATKLAAAPPALRAAALQAGLTEGPP